MYGIGHSQAYRPMPYGNNFLPGGGFGNHSCPCSGHHRPATQRYASTYQSKARNFAGGFGVDLNGDGRMNAGSDGVVAFDLNKDGRISKKEIRSSKGILKSLTGKASGLRSSSPCKRAKAKKRRKKLLRRFDLNRDGKVSSFELQRKGARVLVDGNRNGRFESYESQSLGRIRTNSGTFRLNMLDTKPSRRGASVTSFGQFPSGGGFSRGY